MNRPVPMSQVCEQGLHHQCQGHGPNGPCRCDAPSHAPKQSAADMHAASRLLRTTPEKAGMPRHLAEQLADWLYATAEELKAAIWHVKRFGGDPFEVVDEPGSVARAVRFAQSVNATRGGAS